MPDDERLTPATPDELEWTLRHALLYDGRRKHHRADNIMADVMAEHLAKCMAQSGFVVMKRPTTGMHGISTGLHPTKK